MQRYSKHRREQGTIALEPSRDGPWYKVSDVEQHASEVTARILSVEADLSTAREVIKNQSLEIDMLRAGALVPPAPDPDEAMLMQAAASVLRGTVQRVDIKEFGQYGAKVAIAALAAIRATDPPRAFAQLRAENVCQAAEIERLTKWQDRILYDAEALCEEMEPGDNCPCSGCETRRERNGGSDD